MNTQAIDNDLAIITYDLAGMFLDNKVAQKALLEPNPSDQRDAKRMVELMKIKKLVDRRGSQAGVDPHIQAIIREAAKLGYELETSNDLFPQLTFNGVGVEYAFEEDMDKTSWLYRSKGTFSLYIGRRYGEGARNRYPERADGTYTYAKAAQTVIVRLTAKLAKANRQRELEQVKQSAQSLADELNAEGVPVKAIINADRYDHRGRVLRSDHVAPEGKVLFPVGTKVLTPDQARKLHAFLQTL